MAYMVNSYKKDSFGQLKMTGRKNTDCMELAYVEMI